VVVCYGDGAIGFTRGALPGQRNRGKNDGWVRRYAPDGTIAWTREFGTKDMDLAFGMAVLGALYPAVQAARLAPLVALQHE